MANGRAMKLKGCHVMFLILQLSTIAVLSSSNQVLATRCSIDVINVQIKIKIVKKRKKVEK